MKENTKWKTLFNENTFLQWLQNVKCKKIQIYYKTKIQYSLNIN